MKKNKKTIYETPVIIPLGELARGSGAKPVCDAGNNATSCGGGNRVPPITKPQCKNGSVASANCASGAGVVPP